MKHKHSRGFTLIELFVVVVILAIIATLAFALIGHRASTYEGEMVGRVIEVNKTIFGWKVEIAPIGNTVPYGKIFMGD